jgi:hypothetical protein
MPRVDTAILAAAIFLTCLVVNLHRYPATLPPGPAPDSAAQKQQVSLATENQRGGQPRLPGPSVPESQTANPPLRQQAGIASREPGGSERPAAHPPSGQGASRSLAEKPATGHSRRVATQGGFIRRSQGDADSPGDGPADPTSKDLSSTNMTPKPDSGHCDPATGFCTIGLAGVEDPYPVENDESPMSAGIASSNRRPMELAPPKEKNGSAAATQAPRSQASGASMGGPPLSSQTDSDSCIRKEGIPNAAGLANSRQQLADTVETIPLVPVESGTPAKPTEISAGKGSRPSPNRQEHFPHEASTPNSVHLVGNSQAVAPSQTESSNTENGPGQPRSAQSAGAFPGIWPGKKDQRPSIRPPIAGDDQSAATRNPSIQSATGRLNLRNLQPLPPVGAAPTALPIKQPSASSLGTPFYPTTAFE